MNMLEEMLKDDKTDCEGEGVHVLEPLRTGKYNTFDQRHLRLELAFGSPQEKASRC